MIKTKLIRLIADSGKVLTNGFINVQCIDIPINEIDLWKEIDNGGGNNGY